MEDLQKSTATEVGVLNADRLERRRRIVESARSHSRFFLSPEALQQELDAFEAMPTEIAQPVDVQAIQTSIEQTALRGGSWTLTGTTEELAVLQEAINPTEAVQPPAFAA